MKRIAFLGLGSLYVITLLGVKGMIPFESALRGQIVLAISTLLAMGVAGRD